MHRQKAISFDCASTACSGYKTYSEAMRFTAQGWKLAEDEVHATSGPAESNQVSTAAAIEQAEQSAAQHGDAVDVQEELKPICLRQLEEFRKDRVKAAAVLNRVNATMADTRQLVM